MMFPAVVALAMLGAAGMPVGQQEAVPAAAPVQAAAQAQSPAQDQNAAPPQTATPNVVPGQNPAGAETPSTVQAPEAADSKKADSKSKPASQIVIGEPVQAASIREQRRAAKLYLQGVHLLEKQQPEEAWKLLKEAAAIEPQNGTYLRAAALAEQSSVTQLVQQSSQASVNGNTEEAQRLLRHAQEIDPTSPEVTEHFGEMGDRIASVPVGVTPTTMPGIVSESNALAGPIVLEPTNGKHSFHLRSAQKQVVQEVFRAYGIDASVHESVLARQVKLDLDDASFAEATRALGLVTQTFYEPLDPHRVVVAKDTPENRAIFQRQQMETIYLPGLTDKEMNDVSAMATTVFSVQKPAVAPTSGTITVRAPAKTLKAFNQTVGQLIEGRNQLDLEIKVIQLSHISARETGTTFFQQTGVYNVFSEINSVLSQNQSLVQQIISSGLVPNQSTLTNQIEILAILVASGQLTGTPFNQGFLPFGGGLTQSIVSPSPATLTLSLNSSDTRTIEDLHMRLGDQDDATLKIGERYPIETSQYSSLALTALQGASTTNQVVPQIQYEDLGLTLKATAPKVMRSGDVAISLDLKIESLGGTSLNDIPILNSQQVSGILTLKAGETAVLLSDLSRQESRALSGTPGIADIPGLQDISDIATNQNVARLLILVTPSVVRGDSQQYAHGPMLMVDKTTNAR